MITRLLYIIISSGIALTVAGQEIDEKNFTLYSTKDGLSHNYINSITQDPYGYIWIATYKGLNRFDGITFQQFYSDSSRNSLPQDLAMKLKWLDNQQLAVITFSGLHIINTQTLKSRNLFIPNDPLNPSVFVNRVNDATADKAGNIFIITNTGFYQFNSRKELVFRYDYFSKKHSEKIASFGWNINMLDDNTLLLSTFAGPFIYYIAQKDLHPVGNSDNTFYQEIAATKNLVTGMQGSKYATNVIIPNDYNFFWFDILHKTKHSIKAPFTISENFDGGERATFLRLNDTVFAINSKQNGLYLIHYDGATASYELRPKHYFGDYVCTSLFVDKNNRLWIGTDKGLLREKRPIGKIDQANLQQELWGENFIHTITVSNNKVFAGTNSKGLFILDEDSLKTLKRIDLSREGDAYVNIITGAIAINKDTLYTGRAGFWVNTKNLTHGKIILSKLDSINEGIDVLFKDSRGNIYLKRGMSNIFYYRGADKKFRLINYNDNLSRIGVSGSIAEDPEGNIWFAGFGIIRFNYHLQKFDTILSSFPKIKSAVTGISSNIVFDKTGRMYFGTWENGLIIYDQVSKNFSHLSRSDGLPDNTIHAVCLHNDKLWMGTESGLANYDIATKKISSFGIADGIPTDPIANYLLYYDSAHQQLYGAFRNIIFRFNPDKLTKNNSPPNFFIENLVIAGKETIYHPADEIKLSYKRNNIVINLASVNFEDAYQQQFAYRLVKEGNEPWQQIGSQRSIIFSNLSAGKHMLQVKAFIRNQSWPDQVQEIIINVRPPFWKTIGFSACVIMALAGLLFYLHRRRINHIKQKVSIDKLLAQTEMKALHSQMNPHFIFNCLNSIREMILNNENEQASLYLSKFARLIRITLNHSSKPFVSLNNTIDYLQRYLEMEHIRTSHFTYNIEVDEDLQPEDIFLPPMLIQPFIENAIWHGAIPGKEMQLSIRFLKKNNGLICIVDDNGIGIEESLTRKEDPLNSQSVGIANIRQRIQVLNEKYNLQSSVKIQDKSRLSVNNEAGTIVTLHLPIKTTEL